MLAFILGFAVGERTKSPPEPASFFERLVLMTSQVFWTFVKTYQLIVIQVLLEVTAYAALGCVVWFTALDVGCEMCAMKPLLKLS